MLSSMLFELGKEKLPNLRAKHAYDLAEFLGKQDRIYLDAVSEKNVDGIAALLEDENASVRDAAALSLGQIGPSAKRAIPALERALKEAEPPLGSGVVGPDLGIDSSIIGALNRIRK